MARAMQRAIATSSAATGGWLTRGWALALLPLLIAAIALGLRLQGIDWDGGALYHPDERSIFLRADQMYRTLTDAPGWELSANRDFPLDTPGIPGVGTLLDAERSPLNPHWFPLGSIIIYLLVGVRFLLEPFMDQVRLQDLAAAGRTITAIVDVGAVLTLYALGRRVFGRPVGLLAAMLGAFSVISIQVAHFYRPEPFVVLLALTSFWWMLNVFERGRRLDHAILGLVVGLSFAFRTTSLPLLVPLAVTYGLLAKQAYDAGGDRGPALRGIALYAAGAGALAFATFAVLQPYALLDFAKFVNDQGFEARVARTAGIVPYTVQYVGSSVGLYELRQTAVWALGLPLGIAAWVGLALSVGRLAGYSRFGPVARGELLLVAWVLPFLVTLAFFEVKFLRYLVPVLPIMVLLGSRWMVAVARAPRGPALLRRGAIVASAFVVAATVFYGTAFTRIYSEPHPAIEASSWMNANARPGDLVLTDNHWDEGFRDLGRFRVEQLRMYEGDTVSKLTEVSGLLADAEYLMSYSNRPFGSIARLPERYPLSASYYQRLFDGGLGYELVQAFERYPALLGVSFVHDPFSRAGVATPETLPGIEPTPLALDLGYADGNVTNYDRPLVLVWRNVEHLGASEIQDTILRGRAPPAPGRALLSDADAAEQQAGGTWTQVFTESGLNRAVPWLVWLALVELIFVLALPLSVTLFRWLPDRGVLFARPLGLLAVAWLVWAGASYGVWSFGRESIALAVLALGATSGVLLWRRWRPMTILARRHWRYLVGVEVLFVGAFAVFLVLRASNPDLWHPFRGGEKPMDLSYLTAVVRSTTFPPYDPWYAGGFINYYYFGFVIVGVLMKATGIVPAIAYNLAVPLLFSLTLTGAFSVGHNLAEALRQRGLRHVAPWTTLAAGAGAALLVAVLANLDGAAQLLQGAARTLGDDAFGTFDFWQSSRLMPGQISITEFPFWTFLFADLHAHLIAMPFAILGVGAAVNVALGGRSPVSARARAPAIVLMAFVVGSLVAINTWDVPAYGLIGLAGIGAMVVTGRDRLSPVMLAKWAGWATLFWALLYGLWLPFHQDYDAPFSGVHFSQWRTVLWHYLGIHGLLLFAVGSWLAVEVYRRFATAPRLSPGPGAAPSQALGGPAWRLAPPRMALVGGIGLVALAIVASTPVLREWLTVLMLTVVAGATLALVAWWLANRRRAEAPVHLLLLTMAGLAVAIGIGVDFVTVDNDIDRMNTVFKFYLNAWVLFGIVGAVGLWHLWASGAIRRKRLGFVWVGLLTLLVLASAIYPVLGTRARLADRFGTTALTLDGTAFQATAAYSDPGPDGRASSPNSLYALADDAEALEFMRQNIEGSPVVLEAVTSQYRWTPRVAVYTGLPVVVGWEWHQLQQRGDGGNDPAAVRRRVADVRTMYTTLDTAQLMRLLGDYDVSYMYVGPVERLYFSERGLAKFEALVGTELERFFSDGAVTVYRVP